MAILLRLGKFTPEIIHYIYVHLVRLHLESRSPRLLGLQRAIPQEWFFTPFTPVFLANEDTGLLVCPRVIEHVTDNRCVLLEHTATAVFAAYQQLKTKHAAAIPKNRAVMDTIVALIKTNRVLGRAVANTGNPNFSVRITLHLNGTAQFVLEPHANIHFIHANHSPRLLRQFD